MALATAYIQLFWREMAHKSREVTLNSLDTTFSALKRSFALQSLDMVALSTAVLRGSHMLVFPNHN